MKKIRFVDGRFVAYIQQEDVNTLLSLKGSANQVVFREESIVMGDRDEEGYYKIEGQEAVKYLQAAPFIPDYDTLAEMDPSTLCDLATEAIANRKRLMGMLTSLCDDKKPLSPSDRAALAAMDGIDHSLSGIIERNVFEATLKSVRFREIAYVLGEQSRNYTAAIVKMADLREHEMASESKGKNLLLKRLFPARTATRR